MLRGKATFPDWVVPMAATLTQERFTGPEWIFERKLDGIRVLAFKHGTDVRKPFKLVPPMESTMHAKISE